jgi:hypothetical protein
LGEKEAWPALRVIAINLGKKMSFVEMFHQLKNVYHLNDNSAWLSCVRVKRGLSDTAKKISFTRDVVYFRGYLEVNNYLQSNFENGIYKLYLGKISLEDLPHMNYFKTAKPRFLPDYDYLRQL